MDTGELDVYTLTREQLEAAAALFAPRGEPCSVRLAGPVSSQSLS